MTTLIELLAPPEALHGSIAARRRRAFYPPPVLTADEWADAYRNVTSETSLLTGRWDTSQLEIARGPMKAISDPAVRQAVAMASGQVFKTTTLETAVGYFMHLDPCPILFYSSSQDTIDATVSKKIDPMIFNCPELAALWGGRKALESKNPRFTKHNKIFPGGSLELLTMGSTSNLRNRAAKVVLIDEVDDCQDLSDGDPIELARARTISFNGEEKVIAVSTPTIKGESRIEAAYLKSDMRKPYLTCPQCGHQEYLKFSQILFKDEDGKPDASIARYVGECGHEWTESDRIKALTTKGAIEWKQTRPFTCCGELQHPEHEMLWSDDGLAVCKHCGQLPVPVTHSGFWAWIAYHPRWSLSDIVRDFLDRQGDKEKLREFVNNRLAETWIQDEEEIEAVDPESFASRVEPQWDAVPAPVRLLTLGVDVQPADKNETGRLEAEIVGWGDGEETWSVDYHVIEGDPDESAVWEALEEVRLSPYRTEDGRTLHVQAACVDTGGRNTEAVMAYCGAPHRRGQRVWAIKGGSDDAAKRLPVWPSSPPKTVRHGAKLYVICTPTAKDWIASCISKTQPGPRFMHVPAGRFRAWFDQMLNEKRVSRKSAGRSVSIWKARYEGVRTEALDCRVYAKAAFEGLRKMGFAVPASGPEAASSQAEKPQSDAPRPRKKTIKRRRPASAW